MKKNSSDKKKMEFKPIDERIEGLTETLPDSERKLAELLSTRQVLLATHSATELAAMAGSSKAAVTRFIQRVGYRSFAEARREAREAQCWGSPSFQFVPDLSGVSEEAFSDHLQRDLENITRTFERLNPRTVERAIDKMVCARCRLSEQPGVRPVFCPPAGAAQGSRFTTATSRPDHRRRSRRLFF